MKNNEENSIKREVHEEIKTDLSNGNITTNKTTSTVPSTTVNNAKKAGYVEGVVSENHRKSEDQTVKDNDNAARGLLLGIILASVVGLILGTTYFLNRRDEAPILVPLVVPVPRANQPSPPPSNTTRTIEKEKTIIEKLVPVTQASPVQKAPQPSPVEKVAPAPNININVPNSRQETPVQPVAPAPSAPSNNIKITLPNPQKEPTLTAPTPAPQSSAIPSPTVSTPTPESSPVPSPTPPNPPPKTSSPTQKNDASGGENKSKTNTPSPDSNSGVDGADSSQ